MTSRIAGILLASALVGCAPTAGDGGADLASDFGGEGKSDIGKSAKLVDDIALDSKISGRFEDRIRTYGYVFEAKRGAKVRITLGATAGSGADVARGQPLDTVLALYGPYESADKPGQKMAEHDDTEDSIVPAPIQFQVERDGRYLIAFSSWQYPGEGGEYEVSIECDGTDFQCRRPDRERPCAEGSEYLQGSVIEGDQTWDKCQIILLESATVPEGSTLTIRPGVVVEGNYIGSGDFGDVRLIVEGTLQAAGTEEHPVAFRPHKEDHGWGGLVLRGTSHAIEHAFVDHANVGVQIDNGGSATIEDIVIEGLRRDDNPVGEAGVRAAADVEATFTRAVVKGYQTGLHLQNAQNLRVEDSVVRDNQTGVQVDGGQATTRCNQAPQDFPVIRDPIFVHSDITENEGVGLFINGSDVIVQVEKSNIINNGSFGIEVRGTQVQEESHIRDTNIYGNQQNNDGSHVQLRTFHREGTLDVSWNYWHYVSDPELSESWDIRCGGEHEPTGFAPEPIADAGPRLDKLVDRVKQECWVVRQDHQ